MCNQCELLNKVIEKAKAEHDGHFTIFGFSSEYKVVFGTPELDATFFGNTTTNQKWQKEMIEGKDDFHFNSFLEYDREGIWILEGSKSLDGALENALRGNRTNYKKYLETVRWYIVSEAAKFRAGYHCQVCNKQGELHAHHKTYENLGHEKLDDITVLCKKCHSKFHDRA